MKTCHKCGVSKPLDGFSFNVRNKDGLENRCRGCISENNRQWYQRNKKTRSKEHIKKNSARRRLSLLSFVSTIKVDRGCKDCGYNADPVALQFDHINDDKIAGVARMIRDGASIERILEETEKCEVVCAICHSIRTYNRAHKLVAV